MMKQISVSIPLVIYFLLCLYFNYFKIFSYLMIVLAVHEIGHIFFIKIFKGKINKISFGIFGGVINYSIFNKRIFPTIFINLGRNNRKYMFSNIY